MFGLMVDLKKSGVLGINRRNAQYTLNYNQRRLYPLVDDKLRTKKIAIEAGLSVPELYGVIETHHQIRGLEELLKPYSDFVLKPSRGSGGSGILVVSDRVKSSYRGVDGSLMSQHDLNYHASNILSGSYSLGGQPDKTMVEYRVKFDPILEPVSYRGVPDIRIIVFKGVPVMSMVRLPTSHSGGRANLHQGAIGAGIGISDGVTLTAVFRNRIISEHPDTGNPIAGIHIPHWETLLTLASRCYELTGLGYLGVDIVLDKDRGPLILELNARPGLSIQIANCSGLLPRLRLIEKHQQQTKKVTDRVAFAKHFFSSSS